MKSLAILAAFLLVTSTGFSQEYYVFPDTGWSQTQLFGIHNGLGWDQYPEEFTYVQDSTIDGVTYKAISNGIQFYFLRQEEGKVIWRGYNGEGLLYDFSLNVGDTVGSIQNKVITKQRVAGPPGDSLWYIEIKVDKFWPDTIRWLEGIGDLFGGLLKLSFPDAGYSHICTRNKHNQTIYANPKNPEDCNCDYIHGQDNDQDGFRNHVGLTKYIVLTPDDRPIFLTKSEKVRSCDTLVILNSTGYSVDIFNEEAWEFIGPDSAVGQWEELYYFNIPDLNHFHITHQQADVYYDVTITECEVHDCNDEDSTIHPLHFEVPYNNIDNDCNPETPDDDIDMDGFNLTDDCDDNNEFINPNQEEIVYNGHDDDCNLLTPDDDLDGDGFFLNEDCDDMNSSIFPGAIDIPNNGIDEDCDGADLITGLNDISSDIQIKFYPNPAADFLLINILDNNTLKEISIQNSLGQLLHQETTGHDSKQKEIRLTEFPKGLYSLKYIMGNGKSGVVQIVKI